MVHQPALENTRSTKCFGIPVWVLFFKWSLAYLPSKTSMQERFYCLFFTLFYAGTTTFLYSFCNAGVQKYLPNYAMFYFFIADLNTIKNWTKIWSKKFTFWWGWVVSDGFIWAGEGLQMPEVSMNSLIKLAQHILGLSAPDVKTTYYALQLCTYIPSNTFAYLAAHSDHEMLWDSWTIFRNCVIRLTRKKKCEENWTTFRERSNS